MKHLWNTYFSWWAHRKEEDRIPASLKSSLQWLIPVSHTSLSLKMFHPSGKYSLVRQDEKIPHSTWSLVKSCHDGLTLMTSGTWQRNNKLKASCVCVASLGSMLEESYHNKIFLDCSSYETQIPAETVETTLQGAWEGRWLSSWMCEQNLPDEGWRITTASLIAGCVH